MVLAISGPMPANSMALGGEICDNAVDDDGDGLVDLNDPECDCPVLEPTSLIPNPSFEDMNCCPSSRSQLACADTWIQASVPTTDYLHTCDWLGWPDFPPPLPFPDGEGCMGFRDGRVIQGVAEPNWKEYAGACLLNPMRAGTTYRFEFEFGFVDQFASPPIEVTFFGSPDCANLPFGGNDEAFGCPTNGPGWQFLSSVDVSGRDWVKKDITVTPSQDIYAIAIGPPCEPTSSDMSTYYFFDNLVLADERAFTFRISTEGNPCSPDFEIRVPEQPDLQYQWYKDGVALIGETSSQLKVSYGNGIYRVRILGDGTCNLSSFYAYQKPVVFENVETSICAGEIFAIGSNEISAPGFYSDTIQSVAGCDSIVFLNLNVIGQTVDTIATKIFSGETYHIQNNAVSEPGQYDFILESSQGCDSLVHLLLDLYQVYFPNVFSPNGDGVNDIFGILGGDDLTAIEELTIFDRWGAMIFSGAQLSSGFGWDGKIRGELAPVGSYVFTTTLLMTDGAERQFSGSVMLVR